VPPPAHPAFLAPQLAMLVFFVGMSLIVFATLMFQAEMGEWDEHRKQFVREDGGASPYESIPRTMWWCIVTMTTVGYGDDYPITVWGQLVAIVTMFAGLILLSLPITIIGANFDELYREQRKKEHEARARKKEAAVQRAERAAEERARLSAMSPSGQRPPESPSRLGRISAACSRFAGVATPGSSARADSSGAPPTSPGKKESALGEAPLKRIEEMINASHVKLARQVWAPARHLASAFRPRPPRPCSPQVEELMVENENELRQQIKKVLVEFNPAHDQPSPLEQRRAAAAR
jgi:hypothetical protein